MYKPLCYEMPVFWGCHGKKQRQRISGSQVLCLRVLWVCTWLPLVPDVPILKMALITHSVWSIQKAEPSADYNNSVCIYLFLSVLASWSTIPRGWCHCWICGIFLSKNTLFFFLIGEVERECSIFWFILPGPKLKDRKLMQISSVGARNPITCAITTASQQLC